ncbi:tripartite tricarboxylate transporter substrate binding protein [Polynucleobacter sp. 71A-WALBACH]|uniref:tripartite tricarboxylate transporter substrate binding protein n=1 Tax=Polynucleobacter sp. 71A-WALBACH TaxID=2689097 RepID=UPI001C0D086F|nr:tripartite tricarboxylate transporter substrate binding protein [Polynucleobacter sp. 71A-WALBACH]MBU3594551.1 tripartite tricarboxylate transporter substrate binding protein [Polynucleobacter sp. 71A-WALBACH]
MKCKVALIVLLGAFGFTTAVMGQTYPERPVKLIVPYAPGGSADITARMISEDWGKALGQSMIVENRAGAGGNAGVDAVAKSKPDGYTIGIHTLSLAVNPALYPKMPFDTLKDLAPIGMVASSQHVLVVNPKVPAKDLKELLALLKKNPGKMTYASAGNGSTMHIAPELFKATSNTFITHIPYRGGGPALSDTAGGQVDMSFPVASAAAQFVQSGMLRGIGVTGTKRSPLMPNIPTLAEAGLPAYSFETWFIVFAPTGTPPSVIDKLNGTLNAALGNATLKARMTKEGFDPIPSTPAQARQRLEKEIPLWARLIKERGITSD